MNSLFLAETVVLNSATLLPEKKSQFIPSSNADGANQAFYYSSYLRDGCLSIQKHGTDSLSLEIPLTNSYNENKIINFYNDLEGNRLIVALQSGEIFGVDCDSWLDEAIGIIDSGILSIKPSPDAELLAIITGKQPGSACSNLILMTRDFDIVSEFPLTDEEKDAFVNVGWGKKETQFHGTEGKAAAVRVAKDEELGPDDDLMPRISWRGDGDYFVISFVANAGTKRILHVYNRQAALQNVSENVACLEHSLSWRPSGNLIASTQKTHKHDVVFFERNGLRHGEFTLPDLNAIVHNIAWNADSSLLAVHSSNPASSFSTIQLFGPKNYHWYLRYEIRASFSSWEWDSEKPLLFHAFHNDGSYQYYQFGTEVIKSSSLDVANAGTVAVIDGKKLLLTPFKKHIVPPPMSHLELDLESCAIHCCFDPSLRAGNIAVLLSNGTVEIWTDADSKRLDAKHVGTLSLQPIDCPKQVAWIKESVLVVLNYNRSTFKDELHFLTLDEDLSSVLTRQAIRLPQEVTKISKIFHDINSNVSAFESSNGGIYELMNFDEEWYCQSKAKFPTYCPWISAMLIGPERTNRVWVGQNERNKLYANERLIASDCTSFSVHNDFLVMSTLDHAAKFTPLTQDFHTFKFHEKDESAIGFFDKSRRIEQGAQIVMAVPSHVSLVLEMPRGNLETVYPRAFVLSTIRRLIEAKDYRSAFLACRKHRIDLNLLVDHDYEQFISSCQEFVEQIPETDYLNLFISSLKNEDVSKTMYPSLLAAKSNVPDDSKLNIVCDTIRSAIESKAGNQSYNLSIVTTDAKKNPPALEDAMARIAKIKISQSPDAAEEALKYLIFLVDVDSLYKVALGMYDFALVLMVAQHSHMDPREYLPFLGELKKLDENYQRFRIDDFLKKHEKAIVHLSKCTERDDELIAYMKKHKLFKVGLELYPTDSKMRTTSLKNFASHQYSIREYGQSGMLYEMAQDWPNALESYVEAHMWREAFFICQIAKIDRAESSERLIHSLIENRRFQEVATIYLVHLKDPVSAVDVLMKGFLWNEAILVCVENGMAGKLDSLVTPALYTHASQFATDIKDAIALFEKQTLRLRQVRIEKLKPVLPPGDGQNDENLNNIDMLSDTASMATTRITSSTRSTAYTGMTGMSVKTARTSRQKRKMAKKRATGKDAAYEDEFLIKFLKDMIEKFNTQTSEIKPMLMSLMTRGLIKEAKEAQESFSAFKSIIKFHVDEIFDTPVLPVPTIGAVPEGMEEPVGITPEIIVKPAVMENEWWIDAFSH